MEKQSYSNHVRYVPMFHFVLLGVVTLSAIGACVNLSKSIGTPVFYSASLIVVAFFCLFLTAWYARQFAVKAQDRAIRAEESLRHFAATGKLLDSRLSMKQIVALRFASDEEFVALARQSAESGMTPGEIKKAVRNWRADFDRA